MKTIVDLINLSPSVPLNGDVPKRVWIRKDISLDHLRVFACRAFIHILKDKRSKLDGKSKQCIFLCYTLQEFGYILWDLVDKKIIRSRDAVFLEDQIIENFEKVEKLKFITRNYVNLDPLLLIMVNDDNRRDIQEDDSNTINKPILDNDVPNEYVEQAPPQSLVELSWEDLERINLSRDILLMSIWSLMMESPMNHYFLTLCGWHVDCWPSC